MLPLKSQLYLFNFHDQDKFGVPTVTVKTQGLGQRCNQASVSPQSVQEASQGIALIRHLVCP
jgi:hypothetical protein